MTSWSLSNSIESCFITYDNRFSLISPVSILSDSPPSELVCTKTDFRLDFDSFHVSAFSLGSTNSTNHLSSIPSPSMLVSNHRFTPCTPLAILAAKKKYKPVAKKVQPVMTDLPERFQIIRNIVSDPLTSLPVLSTNPPPYQPNGRYTLEHKEFIDKVHDGDFLWPAKRDLMHHFMVVQQKAFAWSDDE